jgi:hypothetical protein
MLGGFWYASEAATVACVSGDYYVAVNSDAGTQILEGGCGPPAEPAGGVIVGCGMKIFCLGVVACDAKNDFIYVWANSPAFAPPGSFPAAARYAPAGSSSGQTYYGGTIDFSNVVDGSLGGTFAAGPVSGTFCVQWQGKSP